MAADFAKRVVLIAEDEPNDRELLRAALRKVDNVAAYFVEDGECAIDYLKGMGGCVDRAEFPFPDVLMLDLKMPRKNGFEVLEWLKHNSQYRVIPTLVFTASGLDQDISRAYELGANSFFTKPAGFGDLCELLRMVFDYWKKAAIPTCDRSLASALG